MNFNYYLLSVAFLEGYVSLATQILAIRKFAPYFGMATPQTSVIIGIFLLFLSWGYASSEKKNHLSIIGTSFLKLLVLFSFTFVTRFNDLVFVWSLSQGWPSLMILGIYTVLTVGPMAYFYGRTLPILMHNQGHPGYLLAVSTMGSFLGAICTPLIFLHFFGVTATVILNVILILLVIFLVNKSFKFRLIAISLALITILSNHLLRDVRIIHSNEYSDYSIDIQADFKGLIINRSKYESVIHGGDNSAWYNEEIHRLILRKKTPLEVLVLGAGGFTLALKNPHHHYQFVDIDPQIQKVISEKFNSKASEYTFHGRDARNFLNETTQKFDLVFYDLYRANGEIPPELTTIEALDRVKYSLKEGGILALNIAHNPSYHDKFGQRFHLTLQKVFPFCYNSPYHLAGRETLSLYICFKTQTSFNDPITDDQH